MEILYNEDSNEFLDSIYRGVDLPIFVIDVTEDGDFIYAGNNPAHQNTTGLKGDNFINKTPFQIDALSEETARSITQHYQDCVDAEETISYVESTIINDIQNWWKTTLTPITKTGRIYRIIGTCHDITDLKAKEQELEKHKKNLEEIVSQRTHELEISTKKAQAANQAKSEFLANMSHEIRTPMNAVLGFTEILEQIEDDPKKNHYIDNIHTSGKALLNLINDILDLSKIEAGKLDLQYSATSLTGLFSEMKTVFNQKISDKGLEFIVEVNENVPNVLVLDESRMRQVIINLIGNALKFTSSGFVSLRAVAYVADEASRSRVNLTIEVEDSGIGISKDQQDKIFAAFEQAAGQKADHFGGTGLGLAITKRLVKMMNGSITVESEPGKGSTFRLVLPEVEVAAVETLSEQEIQDIDSSTVTFEQATILIADDIDYNREMLKIYLSDWNFKFIDAVNGREAVEKAEKERPDLIVMDMKMPEISGYEASLIFKESETLEMPVIAVTASALKEDEETISQLCDGYLRKPVAKADLIRAIMQFLPYKTTEP